jgi:hypothetical protein
MAVGRERTGYMSLIGSKLLLDSLTKTPQSVNL